MKKVLLFLFVTITLNMAAQIAEPNLPNALKDSIVENFNKQEFTKIYGFLTPEFQKQVPENQFVGLLKDNFYAGLGKMLKADLISKKGNGAAYKVSFEKSVLQMNLSVNQDKKIEGLLFKPFTDKAKKRAVKANSNNPMLTDLDKLVDSVARTYIDKENTAGLSIGVIKDGKEYTYHYGEADKTAKQMADDNTLYEIGSITKTFTGTLLAHAILEKKINLEDDIRKYLPEQYPNLQLKNQPILIKHLANHTSGLVSFPSEDIAAQLGFDATNPYKHYTSDMVLAYLHKVKMDTIAGIKSSYSNYATGLMGIILEKTYKMPYEDLVKKYITTPLSMKASKIILTTEDLKNTAKPHDADGKLTSYWDITGLGAAGAIRSNIKDMLLYAKANRAGVNEALKLAQKTTFKQSATSETGLYWQLNTTKTGDVITWHNGGTGGFSTFCGFMKDKNIALVVLANCNNFETQTAFDLMTKL
jgi:CubicO group peptidase (beta-lactamase class C family)